MKKRRPYFFRPVTIEAGFTLIELMIAMLILSVGLLALAGLQTATLRSTVESHMRTQAAMASMAMAERMRVNLAGVDTNQYVAISSPPAGTAPTSCISNNCSPTQIAAEDTYQWLLSLQNSRDLLSAQGTVTCVDSDATDIDPCTNGSLHVITVMWDGKRNGATGTGCNPTLATDCTSSNKSGPVGRFVKRHFLM